MILIQKNDLSMLRVFEKNGFFNSYLLSSVLVSINMRDGTHFLHLAKQMINTYNNQLPG